MRSLGSLHVYIGRDMVGTLALDGNCAAFQYAAPWLENGYSISPLSLPLDSRVFVPRYRPFEGLFGIFSDSLPDGWGRLLVDRMLRRSGIDPQAVGSLQRLAIVGESGMGALEYRPVWELDSRDPFADYEQMAKECAKIFNDEVSEDLDRIYRVGGSSGGARPKAFVEMDGESWIVKFHTAAEGPGAGLMEYRYMECAAACGIEVPGVRLLPSEECDGYFAVKRFDRGSPKKAEALVANRLDADNAAVQRGGKVHMASASALLETSHRLPNLDYNQLMRLTMGLTRDAAQLQMLFRLMCFNVFAHNRDDHSKNFSYVCEGGRWRLSPAYDLTYSNSLGGEHATTVDGNGANPGMDDVMRVARRADLDMSWARETAELVARTTADMLEEYLLQGQ